MSLVFAMAVAAVSAVHLEPAAAEGGDPIGAFDSLSVRLTPEIQSYRSWQITGWAADEDSPGQSTEVHVYLDGQPTRMFTFASRPDVQAVFPFAGPNSGWSMFVSTDDGPHVVCAYAINVGAGTENTTLGCREIPARGTTNLGDPQGYLDDVAVAPGLARFRGWAGDPDPDSATTPQLQVFEDGHPFVWVTADVDRPDVHATLPDLANAMGFDETFPIRPGLHIYCVDAGNSGSNGTNNTSLGCVVRDVPGASPNNDSDVRGALDGITYDSQPQPGGYVPYPTGWAWDPTTSGPYRVVIRDVWRYLDSFGQTSTAEGTTGQARPDVQRVYPTAPPDTGYRIAFPAAIDRYRTEIYLCVYAGAPDRERFVGCVQGSGAGGF